MLWELKETEKAVSLFAGWQESMIWSCLQGVMGKIYVDSPEDVSSAMAVLGDFCFLAGKPDREFVSAWDKADNCQQGRDDAVRSAADGQVLGGLSGENLEQSGEPEKNSESGEREKGKVTFIIMVPGDQAWAELIEETLGKKAKRTVRYAIKKEPDVFDREKLQRIVDGLPAGYELKLIDEALFERCRKIDWCRAWVEQYADYDTYQKYGLGVVLLKDGEPVSGASSYTGYIGGIEVQIDTREDHRRKGLALICGAKLILECLDRGLYPSWDAQNKWSVALAEKLGYHFDQEYTAYDVALE